MELVFSLGAFHIRNLQFQVHITHINALRNWRASYIPGCLTFEVLRHTQLFRSILSTIIIIKHCHEVRWLRVTFFRPQMYHHKAPGAQFSSPLLSQMRVIYVLASQSLTSKITTYPKRDHMTEWLAARPHAPAHWSAVPNREHASRYFPLRKTNMSQGMNSEQNLKTRAVCKLCILYLPLQHLRMLKSSGSGTGSTQPLWVQLRSYLIEK
jgi:hypothetical protein